MKKRKELNQLFIDQLCEDFKHNGIQAIERVRVEHPDVYLRVITSLVPKEMHIEKEETHRVYIGMEETARLLNLTEPVESVGHTEH